MIRLSQCVTLGSIVLCASITASITASGQSVHTDHSVWVPPRVDVIGPLGNRLPPSHRRTYNRPTYIGGKMAHVIAPTSQEAIAWQRANDRGLYGQHPRRPAIDHYFYPKPWEVLPIGPRRPETPVQSVDSIAPYASDFEAEPMSPSAVESVPLGSPILPTDEIRTNEPLPSPF